MNEILNYKELEVWRQARILTVMVYKITAGFPKEETYGLTSQLRRAGVSIPSNIAEGCGRGTSKGTINFLYNSRGSLFEIETQLILAEDLTYTTQEQLEPVFSQIETCRKLLHGYIRYHESKSPHT